MRCRNGVLLHRDLAPCSTGLPCLLPSNWAGVASSDSYTTGGPSSDGALGHMQRRAAYMLDTMSESPGSVTVSTDTRCSLPHAVPRSTLLPL